MGKGVLFLLTYYFPHWTGLTIYAQRIAEFLAGKGHQAIVFTSRHDSVLKRQEIINKVEVERLTPLTKASRSLLIPGVICAMVKNRHRYQSVSVHLPFPEALPAVIIARIMKKKVYLTHNGDLVLPKGIFNRILEKIYYFSTFWAAKLSDGVIAQTEDYARNSKLLSRLWGKTIFIKAPVIIPPPKSEIVRSLQKRYKLSGKKLIGFAGRFVEEKGFDYLLEAIPGVVAQFKEAIFVFAGETDIKYENFYQRCQPLIDKYQDHLCFLGLINSKEELASFYKMLDVFVISSRTDCFPSAQIEAALSGTPVVCADIPGARQLVRETGFGVIVRPQDADSLAKGIITVLNNPRSYQKNYQRVKENFNWQQSLNKYENLLAGN